MREPGDRAALLEIEGATVIFNKGQSSEIRALNEFTLSIADGDYVTIVGSNGAGKSTLLNMVAGNVGPESGRVRFENRDITPLPDFRRAAFIARVFQNPLAGTSPAMSVEENLALAFARGRRRGLRLAVTRSRRESFRHALERVGLHLEDKLTQMASVLSGGERQSLTVIMATLKQPRILLLDEHTAALDPRTEREVMELTDALIRENRLTTLMVTHNLEHALRYGNRMIMMHRGKVLIELDQEQKATMDVHGALDLFHKQDAMLTDATLIGAGPAER
ncbi:MAG: ATP-binding cassette domain-containing protein [Gaiellaceae bacterium]